MSGILTILATIFVVNKSITYFHVQNSPSPPGIPTTAKLNGPVPLTFTAAMPTSIQQT